MVEIRSTPRVVVLALLLAGCGMQSSPTRVRSRGEIGPSDAQAVQIEMDETGKIAVHVCPHLVTMNGKDYDLHLLKKTEEEGGKISEIMGMFGPMVPCGTIITQRGLCPSCKNPVHLPGERPLAVCPNLYTPASEAEFDVTGSLTPSGQGAEKLDELMATKERLGDGPKATEDALKQLYSGTPAPPPILTNRNTILCDQLLGDEGSHTTPCPNCTKQVTEPRVSVECVPAFRSPYAPDKVIDPVHLMVKGSEPPAEGRATDRYDPSHCPFTREVARYFEFEPSDVVMVLDYPDELVEPIQEMPVDPTMNWSPVASVGVVRNVSDFWGPCWRCGAVKICPECGGSGNGPTGLYGPGPADCWFCHRQTKDGARSTGTCGECDDTGFVRYEGQLPPGFKYFDGQGAALPSANRGWKLPPRGPESSAGEGSEGDESGQ